MVIKWICRVFFGHKVSAYTAVRNGHGFIYEAKCARCGASMLSFPGYSGWVETETKP